jgi:hypothetical protein
VPKEIQDPREQKELQEAMVLRVLLDLRVKTEATVLLVLQAPKEQQVPMAILVLQALMALMEAWDLQAQME